jgi:hypothetical protein
MSIRLLAKSLYALLAVVFLLGGTAVLLLGTGLLPTPVKDVILSIGENNLNTLHLMQEYATLLVLIGLLTFWFIKHYGESRAFHWVMTAFWGLIALIHWFDPNGRLHYGLGEALNSIPFLLFVLLGLLREKAERRSRAG